MTEARDIIAKAVAVAWCGKGAPTDPIDIEAAHAAIAALTAAGWTLAPPGSRVVPEGGVDAETVRICADVAKHLNGWGGDCGRGGHAEHIAKCIRDLAEAKP